MPDYDAVLVVSFGGPEKPDDVMPFLENVLRGKNVPRERMLEVAEHYYHFGGRSPINDQNRELIASAARMSLSVKARGFRSIGEIATGSRFSPTLFGRCATDGIKYAAAFITSAFGSYSGCRQYLDDIARAQQEVGAGAPDICRLRFFHTDPGIHRPAGSEHRRSNGDVRYDPATSPSPRTACHYRWQTPALRHPTERNLRDHRRR